MRTSSVTTSARARKGVGTVRSRRPSSKQIGERLFLSPRTVSTHLHQLFPKLGVASRAALRDALADAEEA